MSVVASRTTRPSPKEDLTLEQIVAEMKKLRGIMDNDRAEIQRLKAESDAIKLETQQILNRIEAAVLPC
jgi:capsule polysaccharide export protein KpsE/RkpR